MTDHPASPDAAREIRLAVGASLVGYILLQVIAAALAGWVFEYPLDDPYIHLAMAEQIAHGGYGVNAGEYASAASSPLYPLLLTPFAGTEAQRLLPAVWNIVGLVLSAAIWAKLLVQMRLPQAMPRFAPWVIALGPVALNLPGLAMVGMEHTLHLAASLSIALGLVIFLQTHRLTGWLIAGAILAPLFRLEGLAMVGLAALVVLFMGRPKKAAIVLAAGVLPVLAFMGFLSSLGLPALPNSVEAKMQDGGVADLSLVDRLLSGLFFNIQTLQGKVLFLLTVLGFMGAALLRGTTLALLSLFVAGAGLAHLLFGQVGWLNRYEVYASITLAALLLGLAAGAARTRILAVGTVAAMVLGFGAYAYEAAIGLVWGPRAIHMQQAQMARFAKDYADVPVAVNDLGWVAWDNPNYVLDLWGLASKEARELRLYGTEEDWAARLVAEKDVPLVMIYDRWLGDAIGEDWTTLGYLRLTVLKGFLGGGQVTFYAPDAADAPALRAKIEEFIPTLPEGAFWVFPEELNS